MNFRRYKEGFDRLGIVAFVLAAAAAALVFLMSGEPYALPEPGTEEREILALALASECAEARAPFASLCRQRVLAAYRGRYYLEKQEVTASALLFMTLAVLAFCLFGYRVWRWVVEGFKRE